VLSSNNPLWVFATNCTLKTLIMSLFDSVLNFLKEKPQGQVAPKGVCPNCWGSQEYADQVRDLENDVQVEVNRGSKNYDFINAFVKKYVVGIQLKNKLEGAVCERCYPAK